MENFINNVKNVVSLDVLIYIDCAGRHRHTYDHHDGPASEAGKKAIG